MRVDGNSSIGMGHFTRCMALSTMLMDDFDCIFISRDPSKAMESELSKIKIDLFTIPSEITIKDEARYITKQYLSRVDTVILDGYQFDTDYQREIKSLGAKLVCIDDIHDYHFLADTIINHSGHVKESDYKAETYTRFYLGLKYALLRQPFRDLPKLVPYNTDENILFICLGGSDPQNDTLRLLSVLEQMIPFSKYYVVTGSGYRYEKDLKQFCDNSTLDIDLFSNLTAQDMYNKMALCSRAITSPSTVAIEYLSTGGRLFLYPIADNQINLNAYLINSKMAFRMEELQNNIATEIIARPRRFEIFNKGIKKDYLKIFYRLNLALKKVVHADSDILLEWINDPITRKFSTNPKRIALDEHIEWFNKKIADDHCYIYILYFQKIPVGMIRMDIKYDSAIISYLIDSKFHRKGFGQLIIEMGLEALKKEEPKIRNFIGYVKPDNRASLYIFRKLNFVESIDQRTQDLIKFVFNNG